MKKILLLLISAIGVFCVANAQDAKLQLKSTLNNVTVYTAGAEMLHSASATLKKGYNELTITDISTALDINSIQLKAPATVTVLSIEFTNKYLLPTDKPAKVRRLEDSLKTLQQEQAKINIDINNNRSLQQILDNNKDIKGTQNGVSVAELVKLMDYYKTKSLELQQSILQLTEKRKKVDEQIMLLSKKIQEEISSLGVSGGRLVVKLSSALAGNADFSFSYISPNAYWIPIYDIKANNVKDPLQLSFKAKVSQTTGIDWKQVHLSLSSSVPSQYGQAPVLPQWFLQYAPAPSERNVMMNSIQGYEEELLESKMMISMNDVAYDKKEFQHVVSEPTQSPIYVVNGQVMTADTYTQIDQSMVKSSSFMSAREAKSTYGEMAAAGAYIIELKTDLEDYINVAENTLNMLFEIDIPYDIPSTGESQTIQIQNKEIPAMYKHYCVPKLDQDAYFLAEVPNWNSLNLLPGEASIIFENTYVGKTFINPSSTIDTLNLTMGKDKRISVKRQKVEDFSANKFISGNKVQKFTYEITVKNNKNESVNLMVKDQFPLSTMKEIEVQLLETGDAAVNTEIGVLTWRLNLNPGESKKVKYVYSVKYPKDKILNLN